MRVQITRLPLDESMYSIGTGKETRFLKGPEVKRYLLDLGVGDSTIAAALDVSPGESIAVEVGSKEAA